MHVPPDHRLLDSGPNLGPLISRWEINKFENCWYNFVRISGVLKLLFQQFSNLLISQRDMSGPRCREREMHVPPDHQLLDSGPNFGPFISRWEINKFENCWYKSVRILGVLKLLFQQLLNLSSSQRDMSGPILGVLSNNRWSGVISSAV
jgi:hypothetical protein